MATMTHRTAMVQIPAGVLAHLFTAADSGAYDEPTLWGFTNLALRKYCGITTAQANGVAEKAAEVKQRERAPRQARQASNTENTNTEAAQGTRPRAARRGSRREQLISLIRSNSEGITRRKILEELGVKGDKSGEMSVSNALTGLTKKGIFLRNANKGYCPGPNIGAAMQEQAQLADA